VLVIRDASSPQRDLFCKDVHSCLSHRLSLCGLNLLGGGDLIASSSLVHGATLISARVAEAHSLGVVVEQELDARVVATADAVLKQVGPLQAAWESELARLKTAEERRSKLVEALAELEKRAANLQ